MKDQNLREALERAQEDINWMLNSRQFLNGHVFDYIDEALTASKPEPQAQAGEPEVAAYIQTSKDGSDLIWEWDYDEELDGPLYSYEPLITLQSHREAMAVQAWSKDQAFCLAMLKKDAALNACVEALENLNALVWGECPSLLNEDSGGNSALAMDIDAAITQAKEAMKS